MNNIKYVKYSISKLIKLDKNKKKEIQKYFDADDKYYKTDKRQLSSYLNKLNCSKYKFNFIFIYNNEKVIGGLKYFKHKVYNNILLDHFEYKNDTYYFIEDVFITNEGRGKNLCSKLLEHLTKVTNDKYKQVLVVDTNNEPAVKCYTKNHFKVILERSETVKNIETKKNVTINKEYLMIR
jgi:RimJ/RimL family protein N-acetyltransferase